MIYISREDIKRALANKPEKGKRTLEPIHSLAKETGLPLAILEDVEVANDAEVHMKAGDLWFCLEGEVKFICGGELVEPWYGKNADGSENKNELKAKQIKGGKEVLLKAGDWLWIPPKEAHQHSADGVCRLAIVKVPVK